MSSTHERVAPVRPARWPWYALAVFLAIALAGLIFVSANREPMSEQVPYVVAFTMFWVVGAVIVSRDRRNVVGLFLLYATAMTAISFLCGEATTWLLRRGDAGPAVVAVALGSSAGWLLGIVSLVFLLPLLFPDGRLPSRRWRPFAWFIALVIAALAVGLLFGQRTFTGSTEQVGIANPMYVPALGRLGTPDAFLGVLYPVVFTVSVLSLFLRFRRSRGIERQQIKWAAFGFFVALIGILVSDFIRDPVLGALVGATGFLAFPVSIGVAVLRLHLYDLDLVVRKAVVYAALALFATAVYLGLVVGLGAWLGRGSSLLTMVAAVVVAVTFQPVRTRLNRIANRLVYGHRATPYEVLSEFSERVGDAYADEDVLPRMARILGEGVGAERADVWLAVGGELRDVAVWPPKDDPFDPIALPTEALPPIPGADRAFAVEQGGEMLGAVAVRKGPSDPVSPGDEKLVGDLAAQAGLVLRNVRLAEELKLRLEDLRAAQRRLVSARDGERRRLERNIHDGAQQRLVALAVKARLARSAAGRDPAKVAELLGQIERETQETLEDLRDLARGIYPPLLADQGLVAALEAQAGKAPVPVEIRAEGIGRYAQDVEAAVYFSVLEGLQNVAKYARASRAVVSLARDDGCLRFEVADDGTGFDPAGRGTGTGLQGVADRLAALDGGLEIRSAPGQGSTIVGRVPVRDHPTVGAR